MKRRLLFIVFIYFLFFYLTAFASENSKKTIERHLYRVVRVIDGDTIKLDNGQHVRLIGIDTPELKDGPKLQRDLKQRHLTKKVELARGKKSYQFVKRLLEGKKVSLKFDARKFDDYQRLLAYVYLADGQFVNALIMKAGYAYPVFIKPDIKYSQLFKQLYSQAKENHWGLWQKGDKHEKRVQWFNNN